MIIRTAGDKDIPCILQVIIDSYLPYKGQMKDADLPSYDHDEVLFLLNDPASIIWVAEQDNEIIGVASGQAFGPKAWHLKMLFVSGNFQHHGVGDSLLAVFEENGKEQGLSLMTANFLGFAKWSQAFYEKHGYREYVAEDEKNNPDLKEQVSFLKKIGRLNNGDKHFIWKRK